MEEDSDAAERQSVAPGKSHVDFFITLLSAGCVFGMVFGALIALSAAFIRYRIVAYVLLLDDYDSLYIWATLLLVGFTTLLLNVYTFFIASDLDRHDDWSYKILIGHAAGIVATFVAAGILLLHVKEVKSSYSVGIANAMQKYNTSAELKRELDTLQIRFSCCGLTNFTDWFAVQWINSAWDIGNESQSAPDNVPYSCCSTRVLRPCITHRVMDLEHHQLYERAGETLNSDGCVTALERYFGKRLLFRVACCIAAVGVFQACIGCLFLKISSWGKRNYSALEQ